MAAKRRRAPSFDTPLICVLRILERVAFACMGRLPSFLAIATACSAEAIHSCATRSSASLCQAYDEAVPRRNTVGYFRTDGKDALARFVQTPFSGNA